jgi:hypothetical protein
MSRRLSLRQILPAALVTLSGTALADPAEKASDRVPAQGGVPAFRPVLERAAPITSSGDEGAFAIGLALSTIMPLQTPFRLEQGANSANFRLQIPASIMVGVEYGWSTNLDLGIWFGLENYAARAPEKSVGGSGDDLKIASYRAYPLEAVARYRLDGDKRITPEFEGGLGYAFGQTDVSSTAVNSAVNSESLNYVRAHASAGAAFGWDEGTTLHLNLGYSFSMLGSAEYTDVAGFVVRRRSFHGVFAKGAVRHRF